MTSAPASHVPAASLTAGQLTAVRSFLGSCGEDVTGELSAALLTGGRSNLT